MLVQETFVPLFLDSPIYLEEFPWGSGLKISQFQERVEYLFGQRVWNGGLPFGVGVVRAFDEGPHYRRPGRRGRPSQRRLHLRFRHPPCRRLVSFFREIN